MLKKYPRFARFEIENIHKSLPSTEQKIIEDYLFYRKSRGLGDRAASDLRRKIIQIRHIIDCDFKSFDSLQNLTRLSVLIRESYLSNNMKANLKIDLGNFFKYLFPDWSSRFMSLDCFSNKNHKGQGSEEGKINDVDLPKDEDVENMLKSEHSTFWKTFLLFQATTGTRTIEARTLEVKNITFDKDKTATIRIFMTKTGKEKVVFTDKQTTDHIKKLIEEKKNTKTLGKYLFSSPLNQDEPISKNSVNKWFKLLSLKATGKAYYPYLLRHKKATELYRLAKENVISKDVALNLMGHSKEMSERYTHLPRAKEIEILKAQAFNIEISPDKKHELETALEAMQIQRENDADRINNLEHNNEMLQAQIEQLAELIKAKKPLSR